MKKYLFLFAACLSMNSLHAEDPLAENLIDLPECGLSSNLEQLRQGVNLLSNFVRGSSVIHTPFFDDASAIDPKTEMEGMKTPLLFEGTSHPAVQMTNCIGRRYYFEILADQNDGGRARYQDEKGHFWEVVWDKDRTIIHDTHPQHFFLNQIVPNVYLSESIKTLSEMIGETSSIIRYNGTGGLETLKGSLTDQMKRLNFACNGVYSACKALPCEFDKMEKSFALGLSTFNNRLTSLESKIVEISKSMSVLHAFLIQLENLLSKTKVIVPCDNSQETGGCSCCPSASDSLPNVPNYSPSEPDSSDRNPCGCGKTGYPFFL